MTQIKLIASDLDGTLLNDRNEVSEENMAALNRAAEAGITLVIATGRNYSEIPPQVLTLPVRYFITANGGYVYDRQADRVLHSHCLTLEQARYVLSVGRKYGGYTMFYIGRKVYTSSDFGEYMAALPERRIYEILAKQFIPCDDITQVPEAADSTQKVVLFFRDDGQRAEALRAVRETDGRAGEYEICSSYLNNVEFNPRGVNKAVGLQCIAERLGLTAKEIAAVGDGGNDIQMVKAAGHAFAVENSIPELKAYVGEEGLLPANTADGVACMVRRLLPEESRSGRH